MSMDSSVEEEEAKVAVIRRLRSLSMGDDEAGSRAELERRPCSRTAQKFTGGGPEWQREEPLAAPPPPPSVAGPPSSRCLAMPAPPVHAATSPGSRAPGRSPPAAGGLAARRHAVRLASLCLFFSQNVLGADMLHYTRGTLSSF